MGVFTHGAQSTITNTFSLPLMQAFNGATKWVLSSTQVRWDFTWQGQSAHVFLGGSGFSEDAVDGIVTSFTFEVGGQTVYSQTGISVTRLSIAQRVHVNDGTGLLGVLYGGNDTFNATSSTTAYNLNGAALDDIFNFGANLTTNDIVVGGTGNDTVSLSGNYTLAFTGTMMIEVEFLNLAAGADYDFTFADANVASGARLTINAAALAGTDTLEVNGAAETNGQFTVNAGAGVDTITGGALADILNGGGGKDDISGGAGADTITGGLKGDTLTGGTGADTFGYTTLKQSKGAGNHDTLVGFDFSFDKIDLFQAVTGIDPGVTGAVSQSTLEADLGALVGKPQLAAGRAILVTVNGGNFNGDHFLIVDTNGKPGYQSARDMIFHLDGAVNVANLDVADFI
jgi:Ca2+-binding RTX toxin-like protein